jgi:hypothetical protein
LRQTFVNNPNKVTEFELALSLGRTVQELKSTLTQRELLEWLVFFGMEPRGDRRLDYNVAWLIYNMRRMIGDKRVKFKDCLPTLRPPVKSKYDKNTNKRNATFLRMFAKRGPDEQKGG